MYFRELPVSANIEMTVSAIACFRQLKKGLMPVSADLPDMLILLKYIPYYY